jgi:Trp operon repressor
MTTTLNPPRQWRTDAAEQLLGVEPIDALLGELARTTQEWAALFALHGPGGAWEAQRKALWCLLATEIRDAAATRGEKITEGAIEQRAHAHPRYIRFCDEAIVSRTRYAVLESERESLTMRVNRGQALLRVNVPQERGG